MKNAAELRSLRALLISGANPISLGRAERPRPAAFARTGKLGRTAARFDGASLAERFDVRLSLAASA